MPQTIQAKIGFVSPSSGASPHIESFKALVPEEVQMDIDGLGFVRTSLNDLKGKTGAVIEKVKELVKTKGWQGIFVGGAPLELMNPGLAEELHGAIRVPVATALESCVTALKAFSVKQVLLMTPFDDSMNQLIRDYLANQDLKAISPPPPFQDYKDASKLGPEDVFSLTKKSVEAVKEFQAIYFQGGVLDPLKVVEQIEREIPTTVVASNPAMLWTVLSRLGLKFRVPGHGKLLEEWPQLPYES